MTTVPRCNQVEPVGAAPDGLPAPRIEIVRREDGRFGWRLVTATGVVIARDAGSGFAKRTQAEGVVERVTRGDFADIPIVLTDAAT